MPTEPIEPLPPAPSPRQQVSDARGAGTAAIMSGVHDGVLVAGRYQLLERIGQGGVGVVWRAHDTRLQREVAVKEVRVPAGAEGPDGAPVRGRLMREAHAA